MEGDKIVCFGEILWDFFQSEKKLGGAPYNVANSLKRLGADVNLISRVGDDQLGKEILKKLHLNNIDSHSIQIDKNYKTGIVKVNLDNDGIAQYEITKEVAWDFIEILNRDIEMVSNSKALIFGSLASRAASYITLKKYLSVSKFCVFDLNLRAPFYNISKINELVKYSDLLKFNNEELFEIAKALKSPFNTLEDHISFLSEKTNTKIICVTRGKDGAILFHKGKWFYNNGYKIKVKDTVGAGDSFLAVLVHGIIKNQPLQETLNKACAMGALVAGSIGANPDITEEKLSIFMNNG